MVPLVNLTAAPSASPAVLMATVLVPGTATEMDTLE
jgi:hypothetical protein